MAGPESWLTPETVEKHAPGIIFGSVATLFVFLRILKSGRFVFGDKVKVLVENAKLAAENEALTREIAQLKARLENHAEGDG